MEYGMSDITNAALQAEIEDSILEAPIVATLTHEGNFVRPEDSPSDAEHGDSVFDDPKDYFSEALYDQEHDAQKLGDDGLAEKLAREEEQGQPQPRLRSERPERESQQEQPEAQQQSQPLSPEVIREGLQELSTFVEANQLNQGESAAAFPHELCSGLGFTLQAATADGFKAEEAITLSSEFTVGGLREFSLCNGDFSRLPQMPDELASTVGYRWAKAHGYDPQDPNNNLPGLGRMSREGTLSILYAINAGYTEPEQINTPERINWFRGELQKNTNSREQIPYEKARAYCNAYAKRVYGVTSQLHQNQQAAAPSQARSRKASGPRVPAGLREGVRGSKAPKFSSNQDIFSGSGFEAALRHNL